MRPTPAHRAAAPLALSTLLIAALTISCGAIAPSEEAAREFTDHFTTTYPDQVLSVDVAQDAALPFVGSIYGTVTLSDDAHPDVVEEVLADLEGWQTPSRVSYYPIGVVANGVGICAAPDRADQRRALREALRAAGTRLSGSWACPSGTDADARVDYSATPEQLVADAGLIAGIGDQELAEQRVTGAITGQSSSVDATWADLAEFSGLEQALAGVDPRIRVRSFHIVDRTIVLAVGPTERTAALAEAADAALGDEVEVEVVLGAVEDQRTQNRYAQWAALADDLRDLSPRISVFGSDTALLVNLSDPRDFTAVVELLGADQDAVQVSVVLSPPVDADAEGEAAVPPMYRLLTRTGPAAGSVAAIEMIERGIADERITAMTVSTVDQTSVSLTTADVGAVAELKSLIPPGAIVTVTGISQWRSVSFTATDQLESADVEHTDTGYDPGPLLDAWNGAGS